MIPISRVTCASVRAKQAPLSVLICISLISRRVERFLVSWDSSVFVRIVCGCTLSLFPVGCSVLQWFILSLTSSPSLCSPSVSLPCRTCVSWQALLLLVAPGLAHAFSSVGWAHVVCLSVSHLEVSVLVRKLLSELSPQPVPLSPGLKPGTRSSPESAWGETCHLVF